MPARHERCVVFASKRTVLRLPLDRLTLADFRAWARRTDVPADIRISYVAGKVFLDTTYEDPEMHCAVKGEIHRVLLTLVREEDLGEFLGGGVSLACEKAELSTRVDGVFIHEDGLRSGRVRFLPEGPPGRYDEIEGAPDWVLEVVSPESEEKDRRWLRRGYHQAGIPEYWLVDARAEDLVFRILLRRKNGYVAAPGKDGWQRSKVFQRSFRLTRKLNDFGLWHYTLHVRED
jgi:Uma2 family endonuclease